MHSHCCCCQDHGCPNYPQSRFAVCAVVVVVIAIVGRRARRPSFEQDVATASHPPRLMRGIEDGNNGVPYYLDASVACNQPNCQPAKRRSVKSLPLISPPMPARSSVVSPPWIIPTKSIVLPPLISLLAHADLPLHHSSQTADQPREEASCLCRQSVHPCPLVCSHTY